MDRPKHIYKCSTIATRVLPSSYPNSTDKRINRGCRYAPSPESCQCQQAGIIPPIYPLLRHKTIQLHQNDKWTRMTLLIIHHNTN
jgi:hypothetical protein